MRACPAVSGRVCSALERVSRRLGLRQLPHEVGVVGYRVAQAALRGQLLGLGRRPRRAPAPRARPLLRPPPRPHSPRRARAPPLRRTTCPLSARPRDRSAPAAPPAIGASTVRRPHDQLVVQRFGRLASAPLCGLRLGRRQACAASAWCPSRRRPSRGSRSRARRPSAARCPTIKQEHHEDVHAHLLHEAVRDHVLESGRPRRRGRSGRPCSTARRRASPR